MVIRRDLAALLWRRREEASGVTAEIGSFLALVRGDAVTARGVEVVGRAAREFRFSTRRLARRGGDGVAATIWVVCFAAKREERRGVDAFEFMLCPRLRQKCRMEMSIYGDECFMIWVDASKQRHNEIMKSSLLMKSATVSLLCVLV